jgi:HAD superfamily hydrolase (TIGR01509 family)
MFDAVIFDCDGVLVDSEALVAEVVLEQLAAIGLTFDRDDYLARFTGITVSAFYALQDAECRARLGRPLPENFAQTCQDAVRQAVGTRVARVPGVVEAVRAVRGRKAVASSSTAVALRHKLQHTGLWPHFDPHVYSANDVARAKPAPDLFLHAARAVGADPARCLAIEDSNNGVEAARAAGMTVWGFTGGGHCTPATAGRLRAAGAARVVANWAEARMLLAP